MLANITCVAGTSAVFDIATAIKPRAETSYTTTSLPVIDLTGATVFLTVKTAVDTDASDSAALIKLDSGSSPTAVTILTPATAGQFQIEIPPTSTQMLTPGVAYVYDVVVKNAAGAQYQVITGTVTVLQPVTNRDYSGGTPTAPLPPTNQFVVNGAAFGITALTGGTSTKLDGLATVDIVSSTWFVAGAVWQLQAGNSATNVSAGYIRPGDYNATTNAKQWVRLSAATSVFSGSLASGVDTGSINIASMGLSTAPTTAVFLGLGKHAAGDQNIFGSVIIGSMTATTISFELTAPTDNANRIPTIIVIP